MSALTQERADVVRTLIQAAPDSAVRSLEAALRGETSGSSLSAVKTIVFEEMKDRQVRDAVFGPITPLFTPRADGFEQLNFPRVAFTRMWRALKALKPFETTQAANTPLRRYEDDPIPPIYDHLCKLAGDALKARQGDFAGLAEMLNGQRPGAEAELAACLELAPIARNALAQLPTWLARMSDERQAAARLMFKDAVAISDDSGPRLIEILFAHLAEPWTILRVVSAVMLKPGDSYASSSELADFGMRLLRDIDKRAAFIKNFSYEGGTAAGREAADSLRIAASVAGEFEVSLAMARDGPWGERLAKQKQLLAAAAEGHLKKLEKIVGDALPSQTVRIGARKARGLPKLDGPPDPLAVRKAQAALAFFAGIRSVANQSGYGAMRAKVLEEVAHGLDGYLEELLSMIHSGEGDNLDLARQYLDIAAEFTGLVHDDQAAQIVRRRAAAA